MFRTFGSLISGATRRSLPKMVWCSITVPARQNNDYNIAVRIMVTILLCHTPATPALSITLAPFTIWAIRLWQQINPWVYITAFVRCVWSARSHVRGGGMKSRSVWEEVRGCGHSDTITTRQHHQRRKRGKIIPLHRLSAFTIATSAFIGPFISSNMERTVFRTLLPGSRPS